MDALVRTGEAEAAAVALAEAVELVAPARTPRAVTRLAELRAAVGTSGPSRALSDLDERAAAVGVPLAVVHARDRSTRPAA